MNWIITAITFVVFIVIWFLFIRDRQEILTKLISSDNLKSTNDVNKEVMS